MRRGREPSQLLLQRSNPRGGGVRLRGRASHREYNADHKVTYSHDPDERD